MKFTTHVEDIKEKPVNFTIGISKNGHLCLKANERTILLINAESGSVERMVGDHIRELGFQVDEIGRIWVAK